MNNEEKIIRCLELTKHIPFTCSTQWMEISKKLYDFINLTVTETESESESENKNITEQCMDMSFLDGANRFYRKLLNKNSLLGEIIITKLADDSNLGIDHLLNKSLLMNYRKIINKVILEASNSFINEAMEEFNDEYTTYLIS